MSEPAWTPGPWRAIRARVLMPRYNVAIADCDKPGLPGAANARLIAAAPELFVALTQLVAEFNKRATVFPASTEEAIEVAHAALARARGEAWE